MSLHFFRVIFEIFCYEIDEGSARELFVLERSLELGRTIYRAHRLVQWNGYKVTVCMSL